MDSKLTKSKPDAADLKSDLTSEEKETETLKRYSSKEAIIEFVDREDELDFLCIGYESRRALMSCGHAVTPMSLTDWCRHLLDQGESRFKCGALRKGTLKVCHAEWSFEEVCEMALLTSEEVKEFETKMFNNSKEYLDVKSCPGCKSSVMRTDQNDLNVSCSVCTADKERIYLFCWQCLREWKGPFPRSDRCENDGCIDQLLETLKKSAEIIFEDVKGVTGCPSIRACPTCGQLVEHDTKQCKNIVCPRCKVEFCFVCLKLTKECLESSKHYEPCSSGVAPRQTSIPVWKMKKS